MRKSTVTIIDIARELQISKSTVSRALAGHPNVKAETRDKILSLADQRDYQKNILASGFSNHKTKVVGIIVPELFSNFYPSIIITAQRELVDAGYQVIICNCSESYENEIANVKLLLSQQVDGIIASHTKETRNFDHFKLVQRRNTPLVMFNRVPESLTVPKVVINDYEAAFQAVDFLAQTGCKRIAHLAGPDSLLNSKLRLQGYLDALKKNGLPVDEQLIISYDLSTEKVKIYVKHFLDLDYPPDAIFTINDSTAIAAMEIIISKGLKIPDDISVVGFGNYYSATLMSPGLTTITQPTSEMGKIAAELLITEMKETGDTSMKSDVYNSTVLKAELTIRSSTKNKI
ncbi:MAG TPA: LacI family DNA-binding transcriptional regulator [Flavisolibacter sp.]|jgi:LacI family transcriptional regulator/LacI family repressor for deo operon, udp, cdd, tsx, nupC, and nupG|nr:LacI family DNA-binding transcriptional regulator [Flavisolibacter sp.]